MDRSWDSILQVICIFFLSALFLAGCAAVPEPTRSDRMGAKGPPGSCAHFFASLDKGVAQAGVIDPGVFRVNNYPYLRVNRFLASFQQEVDSNAAFTKWVDRMLLLDQEARKYEIANLPDSAVAELGSASNRAGILRRVAACGDILKAADFQNVKQRERLRKSVSVPDDYISFRRVLGIYPLTGLFVSQGVSNWHAKVHRSFSLKPPANWRSIRYAPAGKVKTPSARKIIAPNQRDAVGIPLYSSEEREALFKLYAPIWEIRITGDYDRIGAPIWTEKGALDVNTSEPVTYTLLSFTRFGNQILTQLNYIIWFPARPKESALDIYGGLLDGLNYRVTLDHNSEPLLYETMHNCGCYYKAYPTKRLQIREKIDYAEPPLILKAPQLNQAKNFMAIAMESRTHYVQHLYPLSRKSQPEMADYSIAGYGQLRSLPYSTDKRRSMFNQYGIAPGSERLERYILWPTGVLSPGAMRQWGRHAVAFVGKRHFDDPFFMDKMFTGTD